MSFTECRGPARGPSRNGARNRCKRDGAMATTTLEVQGMTCAACVGRVERALSKVPGVEKATVNLATERATIEHAGGATVDALAEAVRDAGYDAEVAQAHATADEDAKQPIDADLVI